MADSNPPTDTTVHAFHVGEWLVEPRLHRLSRGDSVVDIEPKVMRVLGRLARSPGEVVDRETLLEEVWDGTVVTGHVLNRSISQLRKALGDDAEDPRYIETIPKSGYRLIAPVTPVKPDTGEHRGDGMPSESAPHASAAMNVSASPTAAAASDRRASFRLPDRRHLLIAGVVLVAAVVSIFAMPQIRALRDARPIPSIRPITSFPGSELEPAFSPEGDRIAYVGAGTDGNMDVFIKLIDSGDPVRMTRSPDSERAPAWSPDGTRLAFIRVGAEGCHIVIMPALGGNERSVAECGVRTFPTLAWTSDGSGLISSERAAVDLPYRLWHTSLETLDRRPLTDPPRFASGDVDPAVSADGRTLAFVRGTSEWTKDIYRMPLNADGVPERISDFRRDIQGLDWMDRDRLVFAANLSGQYGLWTITATGASLTPVPSAGGWTIRNPAVAPGSGRLSYEASNHDPDVWRMAMEPSAAGTSIRPVSMSGDSAAPSGDPEPFIRSSRWDFSPGYSPDGRSIAFISTRSGSFELWIADADGSDPRQLTDLEAAWIGTPFWSPDGRSILFDANLEGQLELFILSLSDHSIDRLTENTDHDLASGWSADGRSVYFASEQTGAWQMWKMSVEDASARQLTNGGGYRAVESTDGSTLYFHKVYESGLWAVPTSGGEETLVFDTVDPRPWRAWTLVDDDLFYVGYSGDAGFMLGTTSLDDGESTDLYRFDRNPGYSGLTVSPDRKWILFTLSEASESDLVLLEGVGQTP